MEVAGCRRVPQRVLYALLRPTLPKTVDRRQSLESDTLRLNRLSREMPNMRLAWAMFWCNVRTSPKRDESASARA